MNGLSVRLALASLVLAAGVVLYFALEGRVETIWRNVVLAAAFVGVIWFIRPQWLRG